VALIQQILLKEEKDIELLKDVIKTSVCDAISWTYDVSTHISHITFDDFSANPQYVFEINNAKDFVREARIISSDYEEAALEFLDSMDEGIDYITMEFQTLGRDFKLSWVRSVAQALYEEGKLVGYIGRAYDISREKINRNSQVSSQDTLTGLYRREKAGELIRKEIESDNAGCSALILIDIDNFKSVNDTFGKVQGDYILQIISGMIYTNYMSKDIIGRIAGDQFIVFCKDVDENKAVELAERLIKRIGENAPSINSCPITLSVGMAFLPKDSEKYEVLYAKADVALYAAKKGGGNQIVLFGDKSTRDIPIGYTMVTMNRFSDEEYYAEPRDKDVNKKLFDYTFEQMSREQDLKIATQKVFEEVALYYNLDRVILSTTDFSREKSKFFVRWCRSDEGSDAHDNELLRSEWNMIDEAIGDEFLVYKGGRNEKVDMFRHLVSLNIVPVTSLQFPIRDNGEMIGLITFECFEEHKFETGEIETIKSVVGLIRSYLLSQQVKKEMEMETIIYRNVMDSQGTLFYIVDEDSYKIKYLSKFAKEVFPKAQYGCKCYETLQGLTSPCEVCPMADKDNLDGNVTESYNDANNKWYKLTSNRMKGTESMKDILICIADVTEFLERVKSEDTLTVADSYDRFVVLATKAVAKKEDDCSILCTGIRKFSKINDEYGYVVGDEILKRFAELIKGDLLEGESLCRIKGDDFALLIKTIEREELKVFFDKYTRILNEEFRKRFPSIDITCFAGAYEITENDTYINKCVDNALKARRIAYEDMSKWGGVYIYSNELEIQEQREKEVVDMIRGALEEDRLKVFFQPKVDIINNKIVGAEALVRMVDRDGKMISPGVFIPVSEKNGMVVDIDRRVYEKTFSMISKWQNEGKVVPLISVNVSRLHLVDDELPEKMKELALKYELNPSQIELEITESVFFEDTDRLIEMIKRLKDVGFVISMDDFGSGYSTLNFMKKLPVDVIKIDGGFFMKNEMDVKSKAIISAIIQLTKNLEFTSVSEGVETEEQVEFIKAQGGKCVQGYYFYKPLPVEEFEKFI